MKRARIEALFSRLQKENPNPRGELHYVNPYTLLVAVVLSAQATDNGVNKATRPLFKKIKTPAEMIRLGELGLKHYIKSIGLFNTKAKHVIELSELLVRKHFGEVPNDQASLEALPGVGRKTANVVRNIVFDAPTIAVDTHIFRVSNRTGLALGKTVLAVEKKLEKVTPDKYKKHAHHWLILHGRYTCKARKPLCATCLLLDICNFRRKEGVD